MINFEDIEEARETIGNLIKRTPLAHSRYFSDLCGGEVYLKLENLQITNSFKIRGALNKMLHLSIEERKRGVVTASAGNHAQAVAIGAEKLNLSAQIVVPKNLRDSLGLDVGSSFAVFGKDDMIILKKVDLPKAKDVFSKVHRWGVGFAKKKGLQSKDVVRKIHKM